VNLEELLTPTAPRNLTTELSIGDAANELGIPRHQIARAMREGRLPYHKAAGWRWVTRKDLYAWARLRS